MSTQANTSEYLLLFRGNDWAKGLSPEEMQKILTQWMGWYDGLIAEGRAVVGQPLRAEGKVVSGKGGQTVADGPFAESKEVIGGYFLLRVSGEDEAVEIARMCPALGYGMRVEVRPVAERCMLADKIEQSVAGAGATA